MIKLYICGKQGSQVTFWTPPNEELDRRVILDRLKIKSKFPQEHQMTYKQDKQRIY